MKSLWIVNKCCGALYRKLYGKEASGGHWLEAMINDAYGREDSVVVACVGSRALAEPLVDGNITYYMLPGGRNDRYNPKSKKSIRSWRELIDREKPDIIQIWGNEFTYGLAAMIAAPEVPAVINIQGILDSIAKYYLAGMDAKELKQARTLRDVLTGTTIRQTKRSYEKKVSYEKEMVNRAGHIIVESQWATAYYRKMCEDVQMHYLPLAIADAFRKHRWQEATMEPHTLMCSAANYPIKGLHMLLKALPIVKRKYPDVHLYVPGTVLRRATSVTSALKQQGYERFICKLINKLGLQKNVTYTGRLTADEMAKKMESVNAFVMCSAIENYSTTLKEAMMVGTPCVASYVGSTPEFARGEENCLQYRFEDYEVLAQHICRLFENAELREKISTQALVTSSVSVDGPTDYEQMRVVFEKIISSEKKTAK